MRECFRLFSRGYDYEVSSIKQILLMKVNINHMLCSRTLLQRNILYVFNLTKNSFETRKKVINAYENLLSVSSYRNMSFDVAFSNLIRKVLKTM